MKIKITTEIDIEESEELSAVNLFHTMGMTRLFVHETVSDQFPENTVSTDVELIEG